LGIRFSEDAFENPFARRVLQLAVGFNFSALFQRGSEGGGREPPTNWGIGILARGGRFLGLDYGGPEEMYVTYVVLKSPADLAGVQMGDGIAAVNGRLRRDIRWSSLLKQLRATEKGDVVTLTLFDWQKQSNRSATLNILSNASWARTDGGIDLNCWGLIVSIDRTAGMSADLDPKRQRIVGWTAVPVLWKHTVPGTSHKVAEPVLNEKGEPKTEQKPLYVTRPMVTFVWAGKKLTLIRRDDTIEVIEGSGKVPKEDDAIGRIMHSGATLKLHPDGGSELKDK
jgi:hypothetical protein